MVRIARDRSELRDALLDLGEAKREASEEGFPAPSQMALKNAARLLRALHEISPRRFEVYQPVDEMSGD